MAASNRLRREGSNLRGWLISLVAVLIAALMIVAIAEEGRRLSPAPMEDQENR
jgi:hypothetical protein